MLILYPFFFFSFLNKIYFFNNDVFIYNEVIIQLTLKIYNSDEHLVSILPFSQIPKYETQQ